MFDIGITEILIVAVVAIIIVKPEDIPALLHSIGKFIYKIKRSIGEISQTLEEATEGTEIIIGEDGNPHKAYDVDDGNTSSPSPNKN